LGLNQSCECRNHGIEITSSLVLFLHSATIPRISIWVIFCL